MKGESPHVKAARLLDGSEISRRSAGMTQEGSTVS